MTCKPFLKWAGGKRQLLPKILPLIPDQITTYYEPFLGGGAVFFELYNRRKFTSAYIADLNTDVITAYLGIKFDVPEVINLLSAMRYEKEFYYALRDKNPDKMTLSERAARMICLNRTCFNGLYRVNKKGKFNVPFGKYKNPKIVDAPLLRDVSVCLEKADIQNVDFEKGIRFATPSSFIYFDPPYYPLSKTAHFTAYDACGFGPEEQERLAKTMFNLRKNGIRALLSNSDTPETRKLYKGLKIEVIQARRAINSKATKRGKVNELLVRNY